ncbi:MAG TPA: Maf family protein [Pyrinomonadaceae bacterium]
MPNLPRLILASRSPRRAEILSAVGWSYEIIVAGVDESLRSGETPLDYVQRLAVAKAEAVSAKVERGLILGADTTVVVDGQILGQPTDRNDAGRMLRLLNGRWHEVVTGVAIVRAGSAQRQVGHEITRVRFAELTNDEIDWYVSTHEPMDKAGAYGVQGKAALFIEEIQGDYFNVVGLPIRLVYELATGIDGTT